MWEKVNRNHLLAFGFPFCYSSLTSSAIISFSYPFVGRFALGLG